jgi:two-component system, OmpR family, flagellar system response regulator FtcR
VIIVVDKRADVADAYKTTIGREGYAAVSFSPEDFMAWFQSTQELDLAAIEAVVLGDFELRENVTKNIKSRGQIPAIALSDAAALETTLKLFQAGADDVIRKPVHAREIIARIGVIRRRGGSETESLWSQDGLTVFGDGRDPMVNGAVLAMPRRERRILEYLAASRGRRVSRAQIFAAIYGVMDENVEECVVESHISKLRKKLRLVLGYDPIDTQRFLGYQLIGHVAHAA